MSTTDQSSAAGDIVLLTVSGQDRPGLMALITGTLSEHSVRMLDIGQAVIHDQLALGLLLGFDGDVEPVMRQVVERCRAAGASAAYAPVTRARYRDWVQSTGQPRHILTLLAGGAATRQTDALHAVSVLTHRFGLNIDTVRRLSGRIPLDAVEQPARTCLELRLRGALADTAPLTAELMRVAGELDFDFSLQADTVFRRNRRLVAFDMDSTLINAEVIDELARLHGVGAEVAAITDAAMRGEYDFQQSFRRRVALLKGLPAAALQEVAGRVALNDGADRLIRALKTLGYRTAIVSGGFVPVGERLQRMLGIDEVHANRLRSDDGIITGEVDGAIVDAARKAELLREIARRNGIRLAQTIAIGDGANDLPMLQAAGLGVAWHAKPVVKATARHAISHFGLDAVLYLIGFSDRDIGEVLA